MTASSRLRGGGRRAPEAGRLDALAWALHFRNRALDLTRRSYERYGPVVMQRTGVMTAVQLYGPDANRFLLLDRDHVLSARRSWEFIMGRIFGGGLLLRDGEDHRHHRRIMREAFQSAALERYCQRMNPRIARGLDAGFARRRLLAFPAFKHLTLELAFQVFAGVEPGEEVEELHRAFENEVAASMSLLRLPIPGLEFRRGLEGRQRMTEYFRGLVPARRAGRGSDMLSRLCRAESEEGRRLGDDEIADHMNFLMMAAHDTTTSALTSLAYLLGRHPEWQERVRRESLALGSPELAYPDQEKLESLTLALHETLRLYPPLSTIPRVATRDFDYDGYRIPEGAMVSIFPIHTHRMSEWWTEPEAFDPERFSRQRAEHRRHSHLYLPFGGGAHMCLGLRFAEMQIRAIVHQLVQRLRWKLPRGYEMPVQEAPISKPRDGLPLILEPL